jgi:hypothetical protein
VGPPHECGDRFSACAQFAVTDGCPGLPNETAAGIEEVRDAVSRFAFHRRPSSCSGLLSSATHRPQQPGQILGCGSMLRSWAARDGSADFGGSANCSSWRARSGGRSLNLGCRWPTGACHAALTVEGCRDAGDSDVAVSCAKALQAVSVRIAAQIAISRMRTLLSARNVRIEREFGPGGAQPTLPSDRGSRPSKCSNGARHRLLCFAVHCSLLREKSLVSKCSVIR